MSRRHFKRERREARQVISNAIEEMHQDAEEARAEIEDWYDIEYGRIDWDFDDLWEDPHEFDYDDGFGYDDPLSDRQAS